MRVYTLVIDSFGIGALPDAENYGDKGANTALHICEAVSSVRWNNLKALGLGNASELLGNPLPGCGAIEDPLGCYGVMKEVSPGKDTTTGHWEIAGVHLDKPFFTFPPDYPSFPEELLDEFTARTGRGVLGNKAASGTVIIQELGDEHVRTGKPIVYTSADSVFQIAAHEDIISVKELYEMCEIARELCDPYQVARVIARPFVGESGNYTRTPRRHDYSIQLPEKSIMGYLQDKGVRTIGVGKIGDIFNMQGIDITYPEKGNPACIKKTLELISTEARGDEFVFVNLVDTDMVYGHRRDPKGYHDSVAETDEAIGEMLGLMGKDDLLIITADHGCDPTYKGSDHTREHVPLLFYGKRAGNSSLGVRESFADIAATVADVFGISEYKKGESFLV
ncbi:MAG: phosphopentomutase [Spirochaetia bacterium]